MKTTIKTGDRVVCVASVPWDNSFMVVGLVPCVGKVYTVDFVVVTANGLRLLLRNSRLLRRSNGAMCPWPASCFEPVDLPPADTYVPPPKQKNPEPTTPDEIQTVKVGDPSPEWLREANSIVSLYF